MSVYAINKLLYLTENDESFRKRIKSDSEEVLGESSLTSEEREALTSGDVLKLFEMGVHAFLLNNLSRHELFGVNSQNYLPRIRGQAFP
jgi:hypothetical protein